jgi:hypothetical protein
MLYFDSYLPHISYKYFMLLEDGKVDRNMLQITLISGEKNVKLFVVIDSKYIHTGVNIIKYNACEGPCRLKYEFRFYDLQFNF